MENAKAAQEMMLLLAGRLKVPIPAEILTKYLQLIKEEQQLRRSCMLQPV